MSTSITGNEISGRYRKEILLHEDGHLVPVKRRFAYHTFSVPEYTTALQVFLEGRTTGMFVAVFDPRGVRGSGAGNHEGAKGILELTVRVSEPSAHPGEFLPAGSWKILVDSEHERSDSEYSLSVWAERDDSAFLYPWLKPGGLLRDISGGTAPVAFKENS